MTSLRATIERNAAEVVRLHKAIGDAYAKRQRGPRELQAWRDACAQFHQRYDELAFPGGALSAWERIACGEEQAIEAALCFLEIRPYFFRSGYMYKDFMRKLKHAPLSPVQQERYDRVAAAFANWKASKRAVIGA
jgi:hypothetical protein